MFIFANGGYIMQSNRQQSTDRIPPSYFEARPKYLPDSTATAKGHMNRTKCGLRSTTKSQTSKADRIEKDFIPKPNKDSEVEIFIGATIGEQNNGVIYTDQTGNMPVQSYHGKKCHFVAYYESETT